MGPMKVKLYDSDEEVDTDTCKFCTGMSAVRKSDGKLMTSKEFCASVRTCGASIDWEKVYNRE